jgi:hypothetical protein
MSTDNSALRQAQGGLSLSKADWSIVDPVP